MLDLQRDTRELVQYVRASKISVKGKLGLGILKEVSINVSAGDSLELISNLGQVDKNEVTLDSICNALQVSGINVL